MSKLKDNFLSEEHQTLLSQIQEGFKKIIKPIEKDIKEIKNNYSDLIKELKKSGLLKSWTASYSLKQITERGQSIIQILI